MSRTGRCPHRLGTALALLALAASALPQSASAQAAPPAQAAAPEHAATPAPFTAPASTAASAPAQDMGRAARTPDAAAAEALFAELGAHTFDRPLYAVAQLAVTRGGVSRQLILRLHVRGPGHVLVQVKQPPAAAPREDGTVLLLHAGTLHAWFPRADLALQLPALLAGTRLCGSDFALDHLLAIAGDGTRWRAADVSPATLGDELCQRLLLLPRAAPGADAPPPDTSFAALELLLARGSRGQLVARQLDGFDTAGTLVSRVRLQSTGRLDLPDTWTAWTLPPRAGAGAADISTLHVTLLEHDPPVAAELFLPEALPSWR